MESLSRPLVSHKSSIGDNESDFPLLQDITSLRGNILKDSSCYDLTNLGNWKSSPKSISGEDFHEKENHLPHQKTISRVKHENINTQKCNSSTKTHRIRIGSGKKDPLESPDYFVNKIESEKGLHHNLKKTTFNKNCSVSNFCLKPFKMQPHKFKTPDNIKREQVGFLPKFAGEKAKDVQNEKETLKPGKESISLENRRAKIFRRDQRKKFAIEKSSGSKINISLDENYSITKVVKNGDAYHVVVEPNHSDLFSYYKNKDIKKQIQDLNLSEQDENGHRRLLKAMIKEETAQGWCGTGQAAQKCALI